MRDNPLHARVFGADPDRRERRLLRFIAPLAAYVQSNGELLGAFAEGELVGVLGMIAPGRCRPGLRDRLAFARTLATGIPPAVLLRTRAWLAAWARHDPPDPHWHIGPLAVLPPWRRRGIGRRLMLGCCRRMDALAATAWLETDLEANVAFYRPLGFAVVAREPVLGVPTWFMRRPPQAIPESSLGEIDFADELIGARFVVNNPNASSSCGCGTSFSI